MSKEFDDFMDSVKKLSEESWEGCDGCTEQDEVMYKNGYVKGYNAAIAELPKEISFEEYYQETFVSKGSDECQFEPTTNTSSATICKHCGREKFLHKT